MNLGDIKLNYHAIEATDFTGKVTNWIIKKRRWINNIEPMVYGNDWILVQGW
jgi:hypothetical protein